MRQYCTSRYSRAWTEKFIVLLVFHLIADAKRFNSINYTQQFSRHSFPLKILMFHEKKLSFSQMFNIYKYERPPLPIAQRNSTEKVLFKQIEFHFHMETLWLGLMRFRFLIAAMGFLRNWRWWWWWCLKNLDTSWGVWCVDLYIFSILSTLH